MTGWPPSILTAKSYQQGLITSQDHFLGGALKPVLRLSDIPSSIQKSRILLRKYLWPLNQLELNPRPRSWQYNLLMFSITKSRLKKKRICTYFFSFLFLKFYNLLVLLRSISEGREIAVSVLEFPVFNLKKFIFYFKHEITRNEAPRKVN